MAPSFVLTRFALWHSEDLLAMILALNWNDSGIEYVIPRKRGNGRVT